MMSIVWTNTLFRPDFAATEAGAIGVGSSIVIFRVRLFGFSLLFAGGIALTYYHGARDET